MADKKNQSVVAVIDGLTPNQAANIQADIIKSKNKHAPTARGIATQGNRQDIGKMISSSQNSLMQIEGKGASIDGKKK
jgi:hypothetical protein